MARQIAHEIKNPLTPMRLSVQHFSKTIKTNDDVALKKLNEFTSTMLQQIDTMSAVASSFSNFASLTKEFLEKFRLEEEVEKMIALMNQYQIPEPHQSCKNCAYSDQYSRAVYPDGIDRGHNSQGTLF